MPVATTRSKGLRKFIPQPDRYAERYGRFTLTARDVEILEAVHRYRYLEARHIRALVGGSGQQITRRLQGLFHNGYVGRYARRERMRLELDPGAPLIAYGLELHGARALERRRAADAANLGAEVEQVRWKKEYTRRTEWFLEHHLMVSNFRCVLEVALRETPNTELVTWDQGKDTWFRVSIPGERRRVVRVAPDAYFALRQGEQLRHFCGFQKFWPDFFRKLWPDRSSPEGLERPFTRSPVGVFPGTGEEDVGHAQASRNQGVTEGGSRQG